LYKDFVLSYPINYFVVSEDCSFEYDEDEFDDIVEVCKLNLQLTNNNSSLSLFHS